MIELKNVTKSYKNFTAVKDINLFFPSNEISALIGLNGAGKTTILKAIAGIHYPDEGSIMINGVNVLTNPLEVKQNLGFVTEQSSLVSDFTVFEFLRIESGILLPHYSKEQIILNLERIIELCSLQSVVYKNIKILSKGYRQRVSFARALLHNPSVLLLDEPTSGLDPQQIVEMRNLMLKLSSSKTILISTHLMQELEALCTNIAILHEGALKAFGNEQDICKQVGCTSLEKAFLKLVDNTKAKEFYVT